LRYPGGKAPFAPFIADLMVANGLTGGHYLEPYAGGAGVALDLLFQGHASHIHINDADPAVYAFWLSVIKHPSQWMSGSSGAWYFVRIAKQARWRRGLPPYS
jgi:DNA adenine methylase